MGKIADFRELTGSSLEYFELLLDKGFPVANRIIDGMIQRIIDDGDSSHSFYYRDFPSMLKPAGFSSLLFDLVLCFVFVIWYNFCLDGGKKCRKLS